MPGRSLGRYEILEKIGEGGMGEVYLARDSRLNRRVAVKVLPAHLLDEGALRARFRREALSLSRLNHPNIATVHDFDSDDGVDFLVMEYVPGPTLAERLEEGPLAPEETVSLGKQLAEGLQAAHERGVIHRDLKPGNLKITDGGRLKILDFGLAKLSRDRPEGESFASAMTETMDSLGIAGTLPYMSPEQLRGELVDTRSDIHAAGAVLYEMTNGRRRFHDSHGAQLIDAILNHDPDPPSRDTNSSVAHALDAVILRALDRDPQKRQQQASELLTELIAVEQGRLTPRRRIRPMTLGLGAVAFVALALVLGVLVTRQNEGADDPVDAMPTEPVQASFSTVAVLPFQELNVEGQEIRNFSVGLTQELIRKLSLLEGIRVRGWQVVQAYAGATLTPQEVAEELQVEAVLYGTIRVVQGEWLVALELIDAADGSQRWGQQFRGPEGNLLDIEVEVARGTAEQLKTELSGEELEVVDARVSNSAEAFELYLKGAHQLQTESGEANALALTYFDQALELDPELAQAHIGRGAALILRYHYGWGGREENLSLAEAAFRRALELSPDAANAARGVVRAQWESEDALNFAIGWVRSHPPTPDHLFVLANAYFMNGMALQAVPLLRRILAADPVNPGAHYSLVVAEAWSSMFEDAVEDGMSYLRRYGLDADVLSWVGNSHHCLGNWEKAQTLYERSLLAAGESPQYYTYVQYATLLRQMGDQKRAREILEAGIRGMRRIILEEADNGQSRFSLWQLYLLNGEPERAREEMNAYAERYDPHGRANLPLQFKLADLYLRGEYDAVIQVIKDDGIPEMSGWIGVPWLEMLFFQDLRESVDFQAVATRVRAVREEWASRFLVEGL